ncbi:hypothetical protein SPBR_00969 [Sporothrix brasiliensis 5110]|uniref:Uncharacterized protein n=1 Tax=Sporothrix brasiliensis 5110 TaxID=1398154 RepID=A0A0C2IXR4_9PEZI|nr:uncharacterized protein SPBR_00969 [Sporothrix brasiliensis 5110]KIH89832.1 hypothetical protein SPBR_00969 [Sporothrix brasiliensis 5110]
MDTLIDAAMSVRDTSLGTSTEPVDGGAPSGASSDQRTAPPAVPADTTTAVESASEGADRSEKIKKAKKALLLAELREVKGAANVVLMDYEK